MRRISNIAFTDPDTDQPLTIRSGVDANGIEQRKIVTTAILLRIAIRQSDYKMFGSESWEKQFIAHNFNQKLGPHLKEPPADTEIIMEEDQYAVIRELVERFEGFKIGTDYVPFKAQILNAAKVEPEASLPKNTASG